jgi:predicted transcriptional regulator of viral defense system
MPTLKQRILALVKKRGLIRPRELKTLGLPSRYLRQLETEGLLIRLDRGLYTHAESSFSEQMSLLEVTKKIPRGIICLISALRFHNLTLEFSPDAWIALPPGGYHVQMENLHVRYFHFSGSAYSEGIVYHDIDGVKVPIYSEAKTIADCFKFRQTVGLDVAIYALKQGWEERRFSPSELISFARINRVEKLIRPYLETLLI